MGRPAGLVRNNLGIERIFLYTSFYLSSGYDLVINCTGMGAQKLCHDSNMSPVRGQVLRVKAPWIKFCVFADNDTYVIPGNFSNAKDKKGY